MPDAFPLGLQAATTTPEHGDQTAQRYWVPIHIRACSTTTGAVLLDLKRSRYFGIGRDELNVLARFAPHWPASYFAGTERLDANAADTNNRIANALFTAGLLTQNAPTEAGLPSREVDLSATLTSVGHQIEKSAPLQLAHVVNFIHACAWARRAQRARTLYSVATEISDYKSRAPQRFDTQQAIELVCIFRRLRPFTFTAQEQCLFHALALIKFLSHYRIFPTWVIGVRPKPWAAHSWVQEGSLLLDSNPEHVCEYTPILTV